MTRTAPFALALALGVAAGSDVGSTQSTAGDPPRRLAPTNHRVLPSDLSQLWLVPDKGSRSTAGGEELAGAVKLVAQEEFRKALPTFSQPALQQGVLGAYATYYAGVSQLRLDRAADARRTFQQMQKQEPVGYLAEAAALGEAEACEALGDPKAAAEIYERLLTTNVAAPDDLLMRLGRAAKAAGDTEKASRAFARVFYQYPLSDLSPEAGSELEELPTEPVAPGSSRHELDLRRAEHLYAAKRYPQARAAFQALRKAAGVEDRELVDLRIAACDYFLRRLRDARDGSRPYIERGSRQAEALFFYAVASRRLGDRAAHVKAVSRLVGEFPSERWTEEALNDLATSHVAASEDGLADEAFRQLYDKFPTGRYAERAAWKIGWWAYKNGRYADAIHVFERAAADFPRSDYRPPWLYWSARAQDALKESALAEARYTLVATDYLNSYYGRLALERLNGRGPYRRLVADTEPRATNGSPGALPPDAGPVPLVVLPPNQHIVRALLGLQLYDQAVDELRWAQRAGHDSPAVQATLAWTHLQQGRAQTGVQQFTLYRAAVNTMRRAYPQFMAAGGEDLPPDLLKVIFPLAYWDLIRKHAAQRGLDPYLVAALVAQESTFVPDIRSSSNAVGLMQLIPPTARLYARKVKLRYSPRLLRNPEANIRMGTAYLADKIGEFGDLHLALASYNAGERRVHRWSAERPGLERDEFIEDIPFPETQNYVKKILGTTEDYRRLYEPGAVGAIETAGAAY